LNGSSPWRGDRALRMFPVHRIYPPFPAG